ncbi:MAG: S-methyl-5-thioribose-1-phosphate isomerase [Candidatus Hydrothermarchaeales archaeon]
MKTVEYREGKVILIDQTLLPTELKYIECKDVECVVEAIRNLRVRGAPAIGVTAALGLALIAEKNRRRSRDKVLDELKKARDLLAETRPTAVNLFWALERVMEKAEKSEDPSTVAFDEAMKVWQEDLEMNKRLEKNGAKLIDDGDVILTHCNAGALATSGYGTAQGVIKEAWRQGKKIKVFVDETRPLLQGARLTAFEMVQEGVPVTVITDSMAGFVMRDYGVTKVIVGADRIARNGDTVNKIGTYGLAVLAKEHAVPLYVVAPLSTIDINIRTGDEIPIEFRGEDEVRCFNEKMVVAEGADVLNPAFDVTPAKYITAIITEVGVLKPPYEEPIKEAFRGKKEIN